MFVKNALKLLHLPLHCPDPDSRLTVRKVCSSSLCIQNVWLLEIILSYSNNNLRHLGKFQCWAGSVGRNETNQTELKPLNSWKRAEIIFESYKSSEILRFAVATSEVPKTSTLNVEHSGGKSIFVNITSLLSSLICISLSSSVQDAVFWTNSSENNLQKGVIVLVKRWDGIVEYQGLVNTVNSSIQLLGSI